MDAGCIAAMLEQLSKGLRDTNGVELKHGDKVEIKSPITWTKAIKHVELDEEMYGCLITLGIAEIHNERTNCGYPAQGWIVNKITEEKNNEKF